MGDPVDVEGNDSESNLCIIIPAYNEEKRLQSTLEEQAKELEHWPASVLVCDDGSSDNTSTIAESIAKRLKIRLTTIRQVHAGRGQAIRYSLSHCQSRYVAFSSADIVLSKSEIEEAFRRLEKADLVMFSKVRGAGLRRNMSREILSAVFSSLVRVLFCVPFGDTQGIKIMSLEIAKQVVSQCRSKGFFLDAEIAIIAFRHRLRIVEQPWRHQYSRGSTVNISSIAKMALEMMQTRLRMLWRWNSL